MRDILFATLIGSVLAGCADRPEPTRSPVPADEAEPTTPEALEDAPSAESSEPSESEPSERTDEPTVPPPPVVEASPLDALAGHYGYSGGEKQKVAIAGAVEDVVGKMGVLSRGIARRRLLEANAIPRAIAISHVGDEVTVRIDSRVYTAQLDGKSVRVRGSDGKRSRMRFKLRADSLVQIFDAAEGDRINVFTPREGGGVGMHVTITSPKLPADVKYRLSYRERSSEPAV